MKKIFIVLMIILVSGAIMTSCTSGGAKNGDIVQVQYTGKLADGTVFDSSVGGDPLEFTLGKEQMIPGFEKAVLGMKVGEKKTFTIPAAEAYGQRLENLVSEIGRDKLPSDLVPTVGQQLQSRLPDGTILTVIITKVTEKTVTIDANHPLAGKDLTFEIEIIKII
jgi:peptidylprolyl isomerase